MLKVQEVANRLSVSAQTVYRLIDNGELPAIRVGRHRLRVEEQALERFIEKNKTGLKNKSLTEAIARDGNLIIFDKQE